MKWDELQRTILEFERKGPVSQEEIDNLTSGQRRKNLSAHPHLVAHHFHKRIGHVINYMKTSGTFGKYRVKDFFYRVEFQLRGKFNLF